LARRLNSTTLAAHIHRSSVAAMRFCMIFQGLTNWQRACILRGRSKEGKKMKKAIAVMMLLAGGLFAAPRVTIGFGFGAPAPVAVVRPVCPGPGYNWVDGYYAPNGAWVTGYWAAPAVVRFAPRYERHVIVDHRFEHFHR
jgi:hypothetical protein